MSQETVRPDRSGNVRNDISAFTNVDASDDAQKRVDYLKRLNKDPFILHYKGLMHELLGVQPESYVLDVGVGVGFDIQTMAGRVPSARFVGIDTSDTMIRAALEDTNADLLASGRIAYLNADAHHLPFLNETFDAVFSDRTLQHIENPRQAIKEMIRVAKPGGRIVIAEPDWQTLFFSEVDPAVADTLRRTYLAIVRNARIGKELRNLFSGEGLEDCELYRAPVGVWGFPGIEEGLMLERSTQRAADSGVIAIEERAQALKSLQQADQKKIFSTLDILIARGVKAE